MSLGVNPIHLYRSIDPSRMHPLNEGQYAALFQLLDGMNERVGVSPTPHMVKDIAEMVLRHTHSDPETSPPTIDDEWACRN